jgi:pantoate--beta-alanine ligase
MEIIRNIKVMQETANAYIREAKTIGFVPTMGALHEGHLSLVERCRQENDIVVVSIFVNPTQFGPSEDYKEYPRDLEGDIEKLREMEVDIVFCPTAEEMYPEGYCTYVNVEGVSEKLCGAFRPGHFRGVATVVTKLFNIVKPTRAYFGQKDYQQSIIIKRMVEDLNFDIDIIVCPTVREKDGLAMSSRNQYLNEAERQAATVLYRAMQAAREVILSGKGFGEAKEHMQRVLRSEPLVREVQYASVYDPFSLEDITTLDASGYKGRKVLLAIALIIGKARLIDNMLVEVTQ